MLYRVIEVSTWDDEKVQPLDVHSKLLFVYLFTNRHTHVSGIYVLRREMMALELGMTTARIRASLKRLGPVGTVDEYDPNDVGLVRYDPTGNVVWVVNMMKKQGKGSKIASSAANQLSSLHHSPLVQLFLRHYPQVGKQLKYAPSYGAYEGHGVGRPLERRKQEEENRKMGPVGPINDVSFKQPIERPDGLVGVSDDMSEGFVRFLLAMPKGTRGRNDKQSAWAAWVDMDLENLTDEIVKALSWQSQKWEEDDYKFVPKPENYLRKKRWLDEPPTLAPSRGSSSCVCGHDRSVHQRDGCLLCQYKCTTYREKK